MRRGVFLARAQTRFGPPLDCLLCLLSRSLLLFPWEASHTIPRTLMPSTSGLQISKALLDGTILCTVDSIQSREGATDGQQNRC